MYKKLLIFIPHINVGGVEKNFFIITNYLAKNGYVNGKVSNGFDRVSISSELL